jgi:hypothetical protein
VRFGIAPEGMERFVPRSRRLAGKGRAAAFTSGDLPEAPGGGGF